MHADKNGEGLAGEKLSGEHNRELPPIFAKGNAGKYGAGVELVYAPRGMGMNCAVI
jgi:hypothetical protein